MRIVPECIWDLRATLGEGPIWMGDSQALWFVDIKRKSVHRFSTATGAKDTWPAPGYPGFIVPANSGKYVIGLHTGLSCFEPDTGRFTSLRSVEPEQPGNRLNDGYVDAHGNLWFGSMDDSETSLTGALYRTGSNGDLLRLDAGYCVSNGPALSPDGRVFYHTESSTRTIYAFDVAADGTLINKRVFTSVPPSEGYPDGTTVDAEGCLWVGLWRGAAVQRYTPKGEAIQKIRFPCSNVTKIAFGGGDLKTIYATTARAGLTPGEIAEQPLAGGVFAFESPSRGQEQNKMRIPGSWSSHLSPHSR